MLFSSMAQMYIVHKLNSQTLLFSVYKKEAEACSQCATLRSETDVRWRFHLCRSTMCEISARHALRMALMLLAAVSMAAAEDSGVAEIEVAEEQPDTTKV